MKYNKKLIFILSGILLFTSLGLAACSTDYSNVVNAQKQESKNNDSELAKLVAERDRIREMIKSKGIKGDGSNSVIVISESNNNKKEDNKEMKKLQAELEKKSAELEKRIKELQNKK